MARRRALDSPEDRAWLRDRYLGNGWSLGQIAQAAGVGRTTVRAALARQGIPRMPRRSGRPKRPNVLASADGGAWLRERYERDGWSIRQVAQTKGIGRDAVREALAQHGIKRKRDRPPRALHSEEDGKWLRERYEDEAWSGSEIARTTGFSKATVYRALIHHGIPRRPRGRSSWPL